MTISGIRLVLTACTVLAVLTVIVVVHPGPLPGEVEYIRWLQHRGEPLASIADFVRHTTSTLANLIVLALPAALAAKRYGRPARQAVVIALAAMLAVQPMYKEVVDRPRPDETQVEVRAEHSSKSFPSGHSLGTATVWGAAAGLAWTRRRRGLAVVLGVPIGATGVSSGVQGVHWPSDAVAGTIVGGVTAWAMVVLISSAGAPGPFHRAADPPTGTVAG